MGSLGKQGGAVERGLKMGLEGQYTSLRREGLQSTRIEKGGAAGYNPEPHKADESWV